MRRPSVVDTPGERHALAASRLNRLRERVVRPLCMPSFLAATSWMVLLAPQAFGRHGGAPLSSAPLHLLAMVSTLLSPVCVAMAVVLTAVSSRHRPLIEIRGAWVMIGASLVCTASALAALAHHMPQP
jgi:hypothetical protein